MEKWTVRHLSPGAGPVSAKELGRWVTIPFIAICVIVIGALSAPSKAGGGLGWSNSTSHESLCAAYRAAEDAWAPYRAYSGLSASAIGVGVIEDLGEAAASYPDESVQSAGQSLTMLAPIVTHTKYSSIVAPIAQECR